MPGRQAVGLPTRRRPPENTATFSPGLRASSCLLQNLFKNRPQHLPSIRMGTDLHLFLGLAVTTAASGARLPSIPAPAPTGAGGKGQCSPTPPSTADAEPPSLSSTASSSNPHSFNQNEADDTFRHDKARMTHLPSAPRPLPLPPPPPLLLDPPSPSSQNLLAPSSASDLASSQPSSGRQRIPQAMVVLARAVVPPDYGPATTTTTTTLPEHLHRLLPEHCPTVTAAKRAIRRRLVLRIPRLATHGSVASGTDAVTGGPPHPAGVVASTRDTVTPGEVLQLLARRGTGIMGWVGPAAMRSVPTAAAAAAARGHNETNTNGLPVAYEDEHMAVVIKPPGIETQGSGSETVHGRLKYCLRPTTLVGALNRPQQVHRLDASTGGLLMVAKTHHALRALTADLHHRRMSKRYCALVKGELNGSGTINTPLSGKPCLTSFRVLPTASASATAMVPVTSLATAAIDKGALAVPPATGCSSASAAAVVTAANTANGGRQQRMLSKVLLWPHTGRTHQLRKHMAYLGTPILGDPRYRGLARKVAGDRCLAAAGSAAAAAAADTSGVAGSTCHSAAATASASFGKEIAGVGDSSFERELVLRGTGADDMSDEELAVKVLSAAERRPEHALTSAEMGRSYLHAEAGNEDCEVYRPPADVGWVLAVTAAAAAAEVEGSGGSSCDVDVLGDGLPVSLCLWAVGLRFRHPDSGKNIEVDISEWADVVYEEIFRRDTAAA
ncbi:hypothetical protein Vafri_9142 [Volvox africanus]|uniref:Pseudouridine synthase RsuA/RluA-like domain-containing protein n=1 Tax=Volvox africanus TaxID=51714 RepID=A0A8J4B3T7_9CHLO|nr:hypothetical protein Vafri_9142 [Volvox africanus]